ncbi:hypothetical protein OsI_29257 [Oryza sativa Indica Group]|uniref:Uncharacterized protein n=2 Tax=Oryza TaxID=4527 RepID=A0A0E0IBV3_ORYNI|nr:hypothetical protein OsI_29257 [Oryza sativa Indica Group]
MAAAAATAASPGRLRRLMGAATDAVLFTSLCAMWVTNAGSVASILARRAGADDRLAPVAAARGATSFSVAVFSVLLPAFVPMFVSRVESLKKLLFPTIGCVGLLSAGIGTCLFGVPCLMHMLKLPVSALYAREENHFCFYPGQVVYVRFVGSVDLYEVV